jgi:hypothetical protein
LSHKATSVSHNLNKVTEYLKKSKLPIIWIYNEPLLEVEEFCKISLIDLIKRDDWQEIRSECNQIALSKINKLNVPVLLIGGHSDLFNYCNYSNIHIGHPSWQKFLAEKSGMKIINSIINVTPFDGGNYNLKFCWGAELVHRIIHQFPSITPSNSIVESVWDMYFFWKELEHRNWFFEVHPNKIGNVKFAEFLKPTVDNFLIEFKNF